MIQPFTQSLEQKAHWQLLSLPPLSIYSHFSSVFHLPIHNIALCDCFLLNLLSKLNFISQNYVHWMFTSKFCLQEKFLWYLESRNGKHPFLMLWRSVLCQMLLTYALILICWLSLLAAGQQLVCSFSRMARPSTSAPLSPGPGMCEAL